MQDTYQKIWSGNKNLTAKNLEKVDGHDSCYLALYYASRKELLEARDALSKSSEGQKDHTCSITLEANALIHLFSKDFNSAKIYAHNALKETSQSIFANWVLARIALLDKKYSEAIQHYQNILKISPDSDTTQMNLVEAYALSKDIKVARQYLVAAHSTPRKKLYNFFLRFSHLTVRLLWLVTTFTLLALNPYLFILIYVLTTIFLSYIFIKWGYLQGDILLFRSSLYIQSINSIFFFITLCALLDGQTHY
jgi:tetratricopeptide (TPR) repeat protein